MNYMGGAFEDVDGTIEETIEREKTYRRVMRKVGGEEWKAFGRSEAKKIELREERKKLKNEIEKAKWKLQTLGLL